MKHLGTPTTTSRQAWLYAWVTIAIFGWPGSKERQAYSQAAATMRQWLGQCQVNRAAVRQAMGTAAADRDGKWYGPGPNLTGASR